MTFLLGSDIDEFLTLNERGRTIQRLLERQQEQREEQAEKKRKHETKLENERKEKEERLRREENDEEEREEYDQEEHEQSEWVFSPFPSQEMDGSRDITEKTADEAKSDRTVGHLSTILDTAFLKSTLAPFLHEYNQTAGVTLETQEAMLDLLKFSYCNTDEAEFWDISSEIFPHTQFAIEFIEASLKNNNKDGKVTMDHVQRNLTHLNLRCKCISHLDESLSKFCGLRQLNLSWNLIDSLADFLVPRCLEYLNLEMNLLTDLRVRPQPTLRCLQYLNLSWNRLNDFSNLSAVRCLRQLSALDLRHNDILSLDTLWPVIPSRLLSLSLIGNPCSVTPDYVASILHHIPRLHYLDEVEVPDDMKPPTEPDSKTETHISDPIEDSCFADFLKPQAPNTDDLNEEIAEEMIEEIPEDIVDWIPNDFKPMPTQKERKKSRKQKDSPKKDKKLRSSTNKKQKKTEEPMQKVEEHSEHSDFQNEAELCFHCYRVLKFKYVDSLPSSISSKISLPRFSSKIKRKRQKSGQLLQPDLKGTDILYRIEIEVPILNEILHEFVDFVVKADNDEAIIPANLLERMNLKPLKDERILENIPSLQYLFKDKGEKEMTVKRGKELLEHLKIRERDALHEVFKTNYVSNAIPEGPIMEFDPIFLRPPQNNLRLLSNLFYTQVKLHFVQLHVNRKTFPSRTSTRSPKVKGSQGSIEKVHKKPKKKAAENEKFAPKKKATENDKSVEAETTSDELDIVQRTTLHTVVLDQLSEPTWANRSLDFIWTLEQMTSGENLKDLFYIQEEELPERREKKLENPTIEPEALPEELTMHFGISLKRTHHTTK